MRNARLPRPILGGLVFLTFGLTVWAVIPRSLTEPVDCPEANVPIVGVRHGAPPPATPPAGTPTNAQRPRRTTNTRGTGFSFTLSPTAPLTFPALVDSNSPAFWDGDTLYLLNSEDGFQTYRSSGPSIVDLSEPELVKLPVPSRTGKVWLEAVWYDAPARVLYGWYHFEPTTLACLTAPAIGAAISLDHGLTWEDRGFVIENAYDIDCTYDNGYFTGGSGDLSVILAQDRSYFYFLFSTYAGPAEEQGVAVARSTFAERGQPGTLVNFYQGAWSTPGVGGQSTSLFPSSTGWKGPIVEAFWGPSVHWNTYLQRYVMLLNHADGEGFDQEGIYLSFSTSLERWTKPQKLIDGGGWYPQIIGLDPGATDSYAGQTARFFQAGTSCYVVRFDLASDNN